MKIPYVPVWTTRPGALRVYLEKGGNSIVATRNLTPTLNDTSPGRGFVIGGGGVPVAGGSVFYEGVGWAGGKTPSALSTIKIYVTSVDTVNYATGAISSFANPIVYQSTASGTDAFCLLYGGRDSGSSSVSTISRLDYAANLTTVGIATLPIKVSYPCAAGLFTHGYVQCDSIIYKVVYPSSVASILPPGKMLVWGGRSQACASGTPDKIYVFGGYVQATPQSSIDSIATATDTLSQNAHALVKAVRGASVSSSETAGFIRSGWTGKSPETVLSTVSRFNYASNTASAAPAMPRVNSYAASFGNATHSWTAGGAGGGSTTLWNIDKTVYSSGTVIAAPMALSFTRMCATGSSDSTPSEQYTTTAA